MPIFKSVGLLVPMKKKVKDFKISPKYYPTPPGALHLMAQTDMILAIFIQVYELIIHAYFQVC